MFFTSQKQKKFSRLRRITGYYWVKWSYGGAREWRIAWYNEEFGFWTIEGDARSFYDTDFLEVGNSKITMQPLHWWHWVVFGLLVYGFVHFLLYIYILIKLITE
jgi:hypothetical protein